jgi:hypothetical protein
MKKWQIVTIICVVIGAVLLSVVALAASVGSEASKMDKLLKDDMTKHASLSDVKSQLAEAGYTIDSEAPTLKATGPKHSMIFYTTWLYVNITFDQVGTMTGYHLDRAG